MNCEGSVSHINAKCTRNAHHIISVFRRLYKRVLSTGSFLVFSQHYQSIFWYVELCTPTAVFYTFCYLFIEEILLTERKKKMLVHAHLNLHIYLMHPKYITSLNDIDVYMYEYGWIKFNGLTLLLRWFFWVCFIIIQSRKIEKIQTLNKKTFITGKTTHKI